ncbi:MAG: hypothetical protein KIG60_08160 [Caryophanon sp.]|nr:hypothetical protein [Caryophanon sp.]
MKKLLASAVLGVSLLVTAPFATQAEEQVDFEELVYPTAQKDQYTSFGFWPYVFAVTDGSLKDTSFTHMKLTNGKYYDFWDYIFSLESKGNFDAAMKDVADNKTALSLNVVPGKVDAGKVVVDPAATPKTFEVIDIK